MKLAFLFPGQATAIGATVDAWRRASPHVQQLLECASDALGSGLDELIRPSALTRTSIFQPVLTAMTIGIHRAIGGRGVAPDLVAGHSVGELAACAAAGAIADDDAVRLAATRGELMEHQATRHGGAMIAVRGNASDIEAAIRTGSAHGRVCLAAHNASDEWVLSGDVAALRAIESMMPVAVLDTRGAWHSSAMADATERYRQELRGAIRGALSTPIVCNRTGQIAGSAAALVDLLAGQLTSPVQWVRTTHTLRDDGVTHVVVCGPGKSLRRFARSGIPEATVSVVAHPTELPLGAAAAAPQ